MPRISRLPGLLTGLLLGIVFLATAGSAWAQTATRGPLFIDGNNAQGYPIFMLRCDRYHCIGLRGKSMGTPRDVARYMPEVRARDIQRYQYDCWVLCRDLDGNIIGKPSPDYRNPYQRPPG